MVEPLRHRQTKGAATDMFYLTPPRHISTLPISTELGCQRHVRFAPDNGLNTDMASCPSCAKLRHHVASFDHLVGTTQQRNRNGDAERLCGSHIDNKLNLCRLLHGEISWLLPLKNSPGIEAG